MLFRVRDIQEVIKLEFLFLSYASSAVYSLALPITSDSLYLQFPNLVPITSHSSS